MDEGASLTRYAIISDKFNHIVAEENIEASNYDNSGQAGGHAHETLVAVV